jgi:hypothetical protein
LLRITSAKFKLCLPFSLSFFMQFHLRMFSYSTKREFIYRTTFSAHTMKTHPLTLLVCRLEVSKSYYVFIITLINLLIFVSVHMLHHMFEIFARKTLWHNVQTSPTANNSKRSIKCRILKWWNFH